MTKEEAIKNLEEIIDEGWLISDFDKCTAIDACEMAIKALEQEPRWIPVSERLPKENEYIGDVCKYYLIQDEYGDMHVAHLSKVGWIPMDSLKAIGNEIIAWQELPQPYTAESEDRMSKETTCENCIYSIDCIMYEPTMKRCKDYKESEVEDA